MPAFAATSSPASPPILADADFRKFRALLHASAGIALSDAKKPLVSGRLSKRLRQLALSSYGAYLQRIAQDPAEQQHAIDLLTTNETYFFREARHFEFLKQWLGSEARPARPLRIWCGACSSGEEPYTLAMVLAETLGKRPWEILASDISQRMLVQAGSGIYPLSDAEGIPRDLLRQYCLKGVGSQSGHFAIHPGLRERIEFRHINLTRIPPALGEFDVIFLRNVMIYFDLETKRKVLLQMLPLLRPGGLFVVSHSENLNGVTEALRPLRPSIYLKPHA